jgi:glycosyltransferase involved in cell wall biosynthesis
LTPLVSVITPVYNGERYLAECIESVLRQTLTDFEYIIVDNCSSDASAAIAERYARSDSRIRLLRPAEFVNVHGNFCRAAAAMHGGARYCKFVSADDWLYPECLQRMVAVADRHPAVGVVSAFVLEAEWVLHDGLIPHTSEVMPGRAVVRRALLGGPYVTGSPSQLLFRADLVRDSTPFFDESVWHADTDAAFRTLLVSDLGFVHQVLTFTRLHPDALTSSFSHRVNTYIAHEVRMLIRYGREVLTPDEYRRTLRLWVRRYAWYLAKQRIKPSRRRDLRFRAFHRADLGRMLGELGDDSSTRRILRALRALVPESSVADTPGR